MSVNFGKPKLTPWQEHNQQLLKERNTNKNKKQQKEKDYLQSAQDEGLVNILTEKHLIVNGRNEDDKKPSYPGDARSIYLSYKHLRNVTLIDICERLTICNLSNNFLQSIKPLKWCANLTCLDVHSNQISHLPNGTFWSALVKLEVLYMHDNGVFKLEELKHLSHSSTLYNMTLYDTPLSLKKNYRHCVVNAVWTLKALDHCVVSDEEIIEDANFPQQFKPMHAHFFFLSSYLNANQNLLISYKESLSLIRKDLSLINSIQAKWSPVLILQRCIRGFLVRLRYNYIVDTRLWAAVSIQRFYRGCKGNPNPPPSTPIPHNQSLSSIKFDYEAYLKMRRSRHKSFMSMKSEKSSCRPLWSRGYEPISPDNSMRKHISIDLKKLEGKATQILQDENILPRSKQIPYKKESLRTIQSAPVRKESLPEDVLRFAHELGVDANGSRRLKMHSKVGKYHTQYEFLGEVVQNTVDDEKNNENGFRLSIKKPHVMKHDPLEEIILRTVEGADDIRKSIREIEKRIKSIPPPKKVSSHKPINADQKLYLKTQGSMGLSCFRAIDRAYKDRRSAEQLLKRMNHVNHIRDVEKNCKDKVIRYKRKYRNDAVVKKHHERVNILEALAARRYIDSEINEDIKIKHTNMKLKQEKSKTDYQFAMQFNCQNASVGKALANHDREIRKEEIIDKKTKSVQEVKADTDNKKELVTSYLKDVKILRQANTSKMKDNLEAMLIEKSNDREKELLKLLKSHKEQPGKKLMTALPVKQQLVTFGDL